MKRKLSILLILLMVIASATAFASSESLSKNPDRPSRLYAVGETVKFEMQIQNPAEPGDPVNTYYYIDDVFSGDLAHVILYRDKDFNGVIDPAPSPDSDPLVENIDYLIDGSTIILRWINGSPDDPTHVGLAGPSPELIPTFGSVAFDKTLTLAPQDFAYAELHYVIQPEDLGLFITNGINTLGENDVGEKLSAEVETWIRVIDPAIDIEKHVNGEDADDPTGPIIPVGDPVNFTFYVTNTGDVDLEDVDVTDDIYGFIGTIPLLPVDATVTMGLVSMPAEAGQHTNIATAVGTPPAGPDVSDSDPANYFGADPAIDLEKYVNGDDADLPTGPIIPVGAEVLFTFEVENTGNVDLVDVVVTDDVYGLIGTIPLLPVGVTDTSLTYGPIPAEEGQHTNMATATDGDVSDSDPANYFGAAPAIDIEKHVNDEDADLPTGPVIPVGDPVIFTFYVTNTGNVDLVEVVVTDDVFGPIGMIPLLPVGVTETFTLDPMPAEEGQHTNMASATDGDVFDEDPANYYGEMPPGEEGLTPGYWKNNAENWDAVSWITYSPEDYFNDIFGVDVTLRGKGKSVNENPTLLEALGANGGGINALARHATAALLNASHPDIAYPMSQAQIIAAVQSAIAEGDDAIEDLATMLDMYNNYGANLDMHGNVITP